MATTVEKKTEKKINPRVNWCCALYRETPFDYDAEVMNYLCYQREVCPTTGRLHFQTFIQFKNKTRTPTKLVNETKVNFIGANGTASQNRHYCSKPHDGCSCKHCVKARNDPPPTGFSEFGNIVLNGQRSDLIAIKRRIDEGATWRDLRDDDTTFATLAKHHKFVKDILREKAEERSLERVRTDLKEAVLLPWQQTLHDQLLVKPDDRTVHWVYDADGNLGKSWFCKWCMATREALVLAPAKFADLASRWADHPETDLICIDCTRSTERGEGKFDPLDGAYAFAEAAKNGVVNCTKYHPCGVLRPSPHVVFFANFKPDLKKLSKDRWVLHNL